MAAGSQAGGLPLVAAAAAATPQHSLHNEIVSFVDAITGAARPSVLLSLQYPTTGAYTLAMKTLLTLVPPGITLIVTCRHCRDGAGARR